MTALLGLAPVGSPRAYAAKPPEDISAYACPQHGRGPRGRACGERRSRVRSVRPLD